MIILSCIWKQWQQNCYTYSVRTKYKNAFYMITVALKRFKIGIFVVKSEFLLFKSEFLLLNRNVEKHNFVVFLLLISYENGTLCLNSVLVVVSWNHCIKNGHTTSQSSKSERVHRHLSIGTSCKNRYTWQHYALLKLCFYIFARICTC